MNKNTAGIGSIMLKGICVALTLVLGVSLFAAGAIAESRCGKKCCTQSSPMDMHHSKGNPKPSSAGFCNGNPMVPCDLETGQSSELPEFILSSAGGGQTNTVGSTGIATGSLTDKHDCRGNDYYQFVAENSRSAPIYLQNLSLLIWHSPNGRLPSAASQWCVIRFTAFVSDRQPANPAGCKILIGESIGVTWCYRTSVQSPVL